MPRQRWNGPGHARACSRAHEETVRGLVAGAVAKAHAAHAAAPHDPAGSVRAFLNAAALPAVRALNRAGALTLVPAMHRIVSSMRPGLVGPEGALYGYWMQWRTSNQSGWPLSMGDALRLTGEGSATSLHSSAPAQLHALRTRLSMDAAPYLNQARTTYPGGMSELYATLHLLHPLDENLEVGEVTIFVEGAGGTPSRPRLTDPVYNGTRPTPQTPSCATCSLGSPPGAPPSRQLATRLATWPTHTRPPPSPGPGAPTTEDTSSGKSAQTPPCSSSSSRPAGTRSGS